MLSPFMQRAFHHAALQRELTECSVLSRLRGEAHLSRGAYNVCSIATQHDFTGCRMPNKPKPVFTNVIYQAIKN